MNSMIFLKDKSIHICKKSEKLKSYIRENYDDCKYLVTVIDENNTFVLNKLKPYMKKFYRASISYQLVLMDFNTMTDTNVYKGLEPIEMEVDSLEDLITSLHSLNRIRYYNKISHSNESHIYSIIDFVQFHLTVECKDKSSTYTVFDKSIVGNKFNRFGVHEIFDLVKPIYNPVSKFPKDKSYLVIRNDKWEFSNSWDVTNDIIGFTLPYTQSLTFMNGEFMSKIKSTIRSVFCSGVTYDPSSTTDIMNDWIIMIEEHCSSGLRYHDLWTHDLCDIIEYINYNDFIGMTSTMSSELLEYGSIKNSMIMDTQLIITAYVDTGTKDFLYNFKNERLSLSKFYQIVSELYI